MLWVPWWFQIRGNGGGVERVVSSMEIQEDEPLAFVQDVAELCISGSNNLDDDDDFYADLGALPDSSAIFNTRGIIFQDDKSRNSGEIDLGDAASWETMRSSE